VNVYRASEAISERHPALPGHFPGNPIIPGVLVLARVVNAVDAAFNRKVREIPVAKFHAPLRPAERFEIELSQAGPHSVKFRVTRGETLIASGIFKTSLNWECR
jgi:3-hydroxyacyl-[acyl-carrier-protein] dehydratase